jgi:uncharacterized protein (DUF2141 family)
MLNKRAHTLLLMLTLLVCSSHGGGLSIRCLTTIPGAGTLYLTVVDANHGSLKSPGIQAKKKLYRAATRDTLMFDKLPPGVYAVRAFLDKNGNGKMDMGLMGPKEPTAVSWNGSAHFGMPTFDSTRFKLKSDTTLVLQLK